MTYPANALVINGVVIGVMEEHTAAYLIKLSEEGKRPGIQLCELEIPLKRDDFSTVREAVGVDLCYQHTVKRSEVKITLEFVKKSEPELRRA